jgi:F0F1-type ATP synthase membrane subunit b/b'
MSNDKRTESTATGKPANLGSQIAGDIANAMESAASVAAGQVLVDAKAKAEGVIAKVRAAAKKASTEIKEDAEKIKEEVETDIEEVETDIKEFVGKVEERLHIAPHLIGTNMEHTIPSQPPRN